MEEQNSKIYSYHTFFFPFVWSNGGKVSMKEYTKELSDLKWEDISIKDFADISNVKERGMNRDQIYQMLQYFTEAARASIFGWNKKFVRYYAYNQDEVYGKAKYYIKCTIFKKNRENGEEIRKTYTYELQINSIKLRVFNTGVAVFCIETENRQYRTIDDVKRINLFGRRIFAPFFDNGCCRECADELGITGIQYKDNNIVKVAVTRPEEESDCIPGFIRGLLPQEYKIRPAIDDRMFVSCCVGDKDYAERIENDNEFVTGSEDLYELIYIDKPGGCSCLSDKMRRKLLGESVYDRWIGNRTIYGVSHNSMICVYDGSKESEHVSFSFITIYTNMIVMVLAQRSAIIAFDEISSKLAVRVEESPHDILNRFKTRIKGSLHNTAYALTHWNEKREKKEKNGIIEFQKKYIAFCNQHNNIEITCQDQGVEIYEMLQNAMYVKENNRKLEKEINILYETASATANRRLNMWGIAISILFGIFGICDLIELILTLIKY